MDREWKAVVRDRGACRQTFNSRKFKDHYYQVAYDLDWFKEFVFDTDFLKIFEVETELPERLKTDEEELLRFAFRLFKIHAALGNYVKSQCQDAGAIVLHGRKVEMRCGTAEIAAVLKNVRPFQVVSHRIRNGPVTGWRVQSKGYRILR